MKNSFLFIVMLFGVFVQGLSQKTLSEKALIKHISFLADDKLKGRGTGSPEEKKAAEYIAGHFRRIGLTPKGTEQGSYLHNFTFRKSLNPHGTESVEAPLISSQNVVALLDNRAEYTVVLGAHYDHLGLGKDRNSLDPNPDGKIHNGADDNASGVAAIMELARFFAKNERQEKYNFLFICFSGEELGLIGSKKYCESPTIDLIRVNYMINLDMVGRLNEEKKLSIFGVGTAPEFVPIIKRLNTELTIRTDSSGMGPSDHTSFYLKNIPVLHLFTGQHGDYHKPSDDAEKINYPGLLSIADYLVQFIGETEKNNKLVFTPTRNPSQDRPRFSVTMGIMPDYTFDGKGVKIDGVTDGKPAQNAGIKQNDVILQLGPQIINNMQDYMKALGMFKKGDSTEITVKRGAETVKLPITF